MTILPPDRSRPVMEYLYPLYIGAEKGFTISLKDRDNQTPENTPDTLLVADLDFNRRKYIKIDKLTCGSPSDCFDSPAVKNDRLYITISGWPTQYSLPQLNFYYYISV